MITFGNVVLGTHVSFMCKIIRKGIHNSTTKEGIEELKIMQAIVTVRDIYVANDCKMHFKTSMESYSREARSVASLISDQYICMGARI